MTKDTESRSAQVIAELIESIGGSFTATGGNNTISLSIEVLPADLDIALDLLSEALTTPVFDPATFETEREAQVSGLKETEKILRNIQEIKIISLEANDVIRHRIVAKIIKAYDHFNKV